MSFVPILSNASRISYRAKWARRVVREDLYKELRALTQRRGQLGTIPGFVGDLPPPQDSLHLPSDPTQAGPSDPEFRAPAPGAQEPDWPELKACIVGAGIAGLYLAMILDSLAIPNFTYEILESADRIGGRVNTFYFLPPKDDPSGHQYYDVGAMRFPKIPIMNRTFDLFHRVGVQGREIKYYLGSSDGAVKTPSLFNDILYIDEPNVEPPPDVFQVSTSNGGVVPDSAVSLGPDAILKTVFGEYKDALATNWETGFAKLMTVDEYSTREYIRTQSAFSDYYTINWLETMESASGLYVQAFSESVIDSFDFDFPGGDEQWVCLEGGTSLVIDGMLNAIKTLPERKKRVMSIAIDRSKPPNANMVVKVATEPQPRFYSTVFNTTTLACAQRMDLRQAELHPVQKDALRELRYDASSKVAIRFKTPWWITIGGICKGGSGSTDIPIRTCVYPSYNLNDGPNNPAVLLCSYTWAQDAQRIGGLIGPDGQGVNEELLEVVLRDLARLHSNFITFEQIRDNVIEYNAFDWYADPNTSGAFALFGPGQFSRLYPLLIRPTADGNLHFVGEATSSHHAWIVGALNSAWRAVYNFLKKYQLEGGPMQQFWTQKIQELETEWGTIDEMETGVDGTAHLQVILGCLKPHEQVKV